MRRRFEKLLSFAAIFAILALAPTAMAGIITEWTFETSNPTTAGPHAAETGTGSATAYHFGVPNYTSSPGNGSLHSFTSSDWQVGDYYQFTTSSATFSNIGISWDQTRNGAGPYQFEVQYTTDGTTYTPIPAPLGPGYTVQVASPAWTAQAADGSGVSNFVRNLSTIPGLNNNPTIGFRLFATGAAQSTSTGINRVDNFKVINDIPEPCTAILTGMVGFAFVAYSRRSIR